MRLSVVVPTWCEAPEIGGLVRSLAWADEVVVADASSPDGTAGRARDAGARVVQSGKGRGQQLAAGAAAADGDVLLFLHADARIEPGARGGIERALADPAVVGGNFQLRFVPSGPAADLFSRVNEARRRWLGVYYGDSALFVRREVYLDLGGFRGLPIFEDHDFVQRLERHGRTAHVTDVSVRVSARRFEGRVGRTVLTWFVLHCAYAVGVPPQRLAGLYADIRG
jgi:rSAM/selenodomain-associated transferase 2